MKTIKAKEQTKNGIKYLIYKESKKERLEITFPNKFCDGFRVSGNGWGYDPKTTLEAARVSAERFLNSFYSIFGGCEIIYL